MPEVRRGKLCLLKPYWPSELLSGLQRVNQAVLPGVPFTGVQALR